MAHPAYIEYMQSIVSHPTYSSMPNAVSPNGRINWQVSSGIGTSFYKDYLARKAWWISKADELGLPGKGDEQDRLTIAARIVHPTGYRICRLCGKSFNIGYFYLNASFSRRLNSVFPELGFKERTVNTNCNRNVREKWILRSNAAHILSVFSGKNFVL